MYIATATAERIVREVSLAVERPLPGISVGYDRISCTFLTFYNAFLRARTACRTAKLKSSAAPVFYCP